MEADGAAAVRQGYDDGYAKGLARAAAVATQHAERGGAAGGGGARRRSRRRLAAAEESERRHARGNPGGRPKLAFALVEELLGREIGVGGQPGRDAVSRVLALDEGMQPATVRLNPATSRHSKRATSAGC